MNLALGRIFRLLSRPFTPGDVEAYFQARGVILDITDSTLKARLPAALVLAKHRAVFGDTP